MKPEMLICLKRIMQEVAWAQVSKTLCGRGTLTTWYPVRWKVSMLCDGVKYQLRALLVA